MMIQLMMIGAVENGIPQGMRDVLVSVERFIDW